MWGAGRQVRCYYSNKCAAILLMPKTAARMLRASTKLRRRCAAFAREPWGSLHRAVAGHHLRCVPTRRLMTARTKPGTQSECAASWLDKDGNSCGRGCCFLVRTWRAVPVGRSYRRAPLPTHKSCPIPPTLVAVLLAHVSRHSLPTCIRVVAALSLPQFNCALDSCITSIRNANREWPIPTALRPHVLSALGAPADRALTFLGLFCRINKAKATYVVLLRGTLQGLLSNSPPAILWEVSNRLSAIRRDVLS